MTFSWKHLSRIGMIVGVSTFFLMGFLGLTHFAVPGMSGEMVDCPLMPGTGLCEMIPLEHLSLWQSVFTVAPHLLTTTVTVLILSLFSIGFLVRFERVVSLPRHVRKMFVRYMSHHELTPLPELALAFSNGILNPKTY